MISQFHCIAGLPRSGTTLLSAILQQNPRFVTGIQSPVQSIWSALRTILSNRLTAIVSQDTIQRTLRSTVDSYYGNVAEDQVVFDSHRGWPKELPGLVDIFPHAKIICCVRSPAWILDSIERHVTKQYWQSAPALFGGGPDELKPSDVYTRSEFLMKNLVGSCIRILRMAWFSELADHIICIRYESLSERPQQTIERLYGILEEPCFVHQFKGIQFDRPEYDDAIGLPGFHSVRPDVSPAYRESILPLDIFRKHDHCFWNEPHENPRGVPIL